MRSKALIVGAVLSLFALSSSVGHVDAAKSKPKPRAPFATYHVNEVYVTITKKLVVNNASDSGDINNHHRVMLLFLSVQNRNDVIVGFDPSTFSVTDALDQPVQLADLCANQSNIDSENTRLLKAYYPRLCSQPFLQNNNHLAPNQSVSGSIGFDLPDGQNHFTIKWSPTGATDGGITWPTPSWTIYY